MKNNATASHPNECVKSIGTDNKVSANKKIKNLEALESFHLIVPLMIAAIPLPKAQIAKRSPDLFSWPLASANATVTIAIEPKKPPNIVVARTTA